MAAGTTIQLKRKAGAFIGGNLAAGELGVDTTNGVLYLSKEGSTVTSVGSSGATYTQSDTAPSSPANGDKWLDTTTAIEYVRYDSQWISDAPTPSITDSVVAVGTVTTAHTFVLSSGTVQTATLTASTACTFTMPTATAGRSFSVYLKQAASTGNGTATFTSVKWSGATAPVITATAGRMDILSFVSDGTNWYGSFIQNYTP